MKLITETHFDDVSHSAQICESTGVKEWYIDGVFLQEEVKNRNGRIYPGAVMKPEVARFINEKVSRNQAFGELNHPEYPLPNPKYATHKIMELRQEGNNYIGRAKILSKHPAAAPVIGLLEDGVQLGVSSRGLGSLRESNGVKVVQSDFRLNTIDIVSDPSGIDCWVNGLMEGVEWVWEGGVLVEQKISAMQDDINKASRSDRESIILERFEEFFKPQNLKLHK